MPCAPELETYLQKREIIADIGHTQLSPTDAARSVKNGAKIVTHLFDAMGCWRSTETIAKSGTLQESADVILLATPDLYYELICDNDDYCVKPANVRFALRTASEDFIILISNCAADFGVDSESRFHICNNKREKLLGNSLTLSEACRNFMRVTKTDVRTVFKCASTNPAKALGLDAQLGSILPGRVANLLVVDKEFQVQDVYFKGEKIERGA